jgi:hypothetical protein
MMWSKTFTLRTTREEVFGNLYFQRFSGPITKSLLDHSIPLTFPFAHRPPALDLWKIKTAGMFPKIRSATEIRVWGTNPKPSRTSKIRAGLRLILFSDTHQLHREVEVPDGDLCIVAGDFTCFSKSIRAILDFNARLSAHETIKTFLVPGEEVR